MRRRNSPVQQWVDSLPSPIKSSASSFASISRQQSAFETAITTTTTITTIEQPVSFIINGKEKHIENEDMTVSAPIVVPGSRAVSCPSNLKLARDPSFQSDSSQCSSVESLLELRKADPEAVLLSLGFAGGSNSPQDGGSLSRIPKRFLQPSKLKGIVIDDFVKHEQEASESLDSTSLGYRGLTGSPYVAPSEIVQKIMQRLREHEYQQELQEMYLQQNSANQQNGCQTDESYLPQQQDYSRLSVLSPDNRQFLEKPRSKSPDMRNKRMIIGQRSFAFGRDGDLIEINPLSTQSSEENDDVFEIMETIDATKNMIIQTTGPINTTTDMQYESNTTSSEHKRLRSNRDSSETVVPIENQNDDVYMSFASVDKYHNCRDIDDDGRLDETMRRASEGSSEKSSRTSFLEQEEGRGHSDSALQSDTVSRKKCLRRQAKIREASNNERIVPLEEEMDGTSKKQCFHCGRPDDEEKEDDDSNCCYERSTNQSCWWEVEKVKEKNKKLEDTVAKSRREISEIRDMLSSVLSIRMEPGF